MDEAERVIASNVFEEVDFPHMAKGRIALLGDGLSPLTCLIDIGELHTDLGLSLAAHSMTSFFGQVKLNSRYNYKGARLTQLAEIGSLPSDRGRSCSRRLDH